MSGGGGGSWYKPEFQGSPKDLTLGHLEHLKFRGGDAESLEFRYPGQKWVLGHAIPPFQRPLVWSEAQKVRFVESAARGLHLGTWVYNSAAHAPCVKVDGIERMPRTDRWLIDGQQRFDALNDFWDDRFPVFGKLWSEVPMVDRRRFLNQNFVAQEIAATDEMELRRLYDRLNFGGVPHTPDQRAVPEDEEDEAAPSPGMR